MKQPPSKFAPATPENVNALAAWLDAITAFGIAADGHPWLFYEKLDEYLGPWGESGYLIGYGKKYCKLFYEDEHLQRNRAGRAWVIRTLQLLQNALKDFVLDHFRKGTLGIMPPDELKRAAFKSHAQAYTEGGLTLVLIVSPGLIRHIVEIPIGEFLPWKQNARASWSQAFETAGISASEALDHVQTAISFGGYGDAHHLDTMAIDHIYEVNDALRVVRRLLESGRLDHVGRLDEIEERLEGARWPDHDMAEAASSLLSEVRFRRGRVFARYLQESKNDRSLEAIYKAFDPRAF